MQKISEALRRLAARLLQSGQVDLVLGYARDGAAERSIPFVATSPTETEQLVFDDTCARALPKYLLQDSFQGKRTAVVVKGCDFRALKLMLEENRVQREQVYVIGVDCPGILREGGGEEAAGLSPFCLSCQHPAPPKDQVDVLLSNEATPERNQALSRQEAFPEIAAIEQMTEDERFEYWQRQLNRCRRCFACRNACPVCTCRVCLFDRENPDFLDPAKDQLAQHQFYHIIRAFHVSDRCVGCGECSRVCPEGIPLHLLHQKLQGDLDRFYGSYTPGVDRLPAPLSHAEATEPDFFGKGGN